MREYILNAIDANPAKDAYFPALTAIEVLQTIGLKFPSNIQCKECAGILRELFGESKKVNGKVTWRVPLRHCQTAATPKVDDADLY